MGCNRILRRWPVMLWMMVGALLGGCGGGSGSVSGDNGGGSALTTPAQGKAASAAASQGAAVVANVGQTLANLSAPVASVAGLPLPAAGLRPTTADTRHASIHAVERKALQSKAARLSGRLHALQSAAAPRVASALVPLPAETEVCADGGDYTVSGTTNDADGSFSLTVVFNMCREEGTQLNGTVAAEGNEIAGTFTLKTGNDDGAADDSDLAVDLFTDATYANLFANYRADLRGSVTANRAGTATSYAMNGRVSYDDFSSRFELQFSNFTLAQSAQGASGSNTVNGGFVETWTVEGVTRRASFGFTDFTQAWTQTADYVDLSIDGTISVDLTPDDLCEGQGEGTFVYNTTTPIRIDGTTNTTTAGRFSINRDAVTVFNADGTVTVTVNGQSATYHSLEAVEAACPIKDFEADILSEVSGGTGTVTADELTATLSWNTAGTDMDLHLTYYASSAPLATAPATWHMGWNTPGQGLGGVDVDSDGAGDVDLDYDDVDGFGPEHITAKKLPVGYYVLSVNSYYHAGMATGVVVVLNVGGTLFSFPTHTFFASDAESSDPESWFRVADIRVNEDGTVNVLTPDPSLPAWSTHVSASVVKMKTRKR